MDKVLESDYQQTIEAMQEQIDAMLKTAKAREERIKTLEEAGNEMYIECATSSVRGHHAKMDWYELTKERQAEVSDESGRYD